MAELSGKVGGIYYRKAYIQAATIAFVDGGVGVDSITDTGAGFVTAGFANSMYITCSGSTDEGNNNTFQVGASGLAAGTLTLSESGILTAHGIGETITIVEALPGTVCGGFYNWTVNKNASISDITDFVDANAGYKTKLANIAAWTATAEGYWLSDSIYNWSGSEKLFRFFTVYSASPNTTTVYYWEGTGMISGIDTSVTPNEVIKQTFTIEGSSALTYTTRSTAWPT